MGRRARRLTVDFSECVCCHVISRCTRQLHLFGGSDEERAKRKDVLLRHLERVATASSVGVAGWSVMDNHLHLVLKADPQAAKSWSDREVARRWLVLHPPRDGYRRKVAVEPRHLDAVLNAAPQGVEGARAHRVEELREKLTSVSHFMKELKQEVTQDLNRLDQTVGSVWAGRFKCKRIVDEAQLLTTLAYVDLNPFAAGACETPEAGEYTSLAARLGRVGEGEGVAEERVLVGGGGLAQRDGKVSQREGTASGVGLMTGRMPVPLGAKKGQAEGRAPREQRGWWMTVGGGQPGSAGRRRALLPDTDLTFGRYLKLLDAVSRLMRRGKKRMAGDARTISARLGVSPVGVADTLRGWFEEGLPWDRPRAAVG